MRCRSHTPNESVLSHRARRRARRAPAAAVLTSLRALIALLTRFRTPPFAQEFRNTFLCLAAGGGLSAVVCLPDWPWWNLHPPEWQPSLDEEAVEKAEVAAEERKAAKKKKKKAEKAE